MDDSGRAISTSVAAIDIRILPCPREEIARDARERRKYSHSLPLMHCDKYDLMHDILEIRDTRITREFSTISRIVTSTNTRARSGHFYK